MKTIRTLKTCALVMGLALCGSAAANAQSSVKYIQVANASQQTVTPQFINLLAVSFEADAIDMLNNFDVNASNGSVIKGRILHHYIPKSADAYAMNARKGPVRSLTQADRDVRTVYDNYLRDDHPIDLVEIAYRN